MKRICVVILCLCTLIILTGCYYKYWLGNRPLDQESSTWRSEDGRVEFYMEKGGSGVGVLHTENGDIDIHVSIGPTTEINIYDQSCVEGNLVNGLPFETWRGDFKHDDRFTATVEETTYFEVGEKIVFYRVDTE